MSCVLDLLSASNFDLVDGRGNTYLHMVRIELHLFYYSAILIASYSSWWCVQERIALTLTVGSMC